MEASKVDGQPEKTTFFGVHIPPDAQNEDVFSHVLENRTEALKLVKKHKKARFKAFASYNDALAFALLGAAEGANGAEQQQQPQVVVGEKAPLFRAPKPQDLTALRKLIENGQLKLVEATVWANPRYLISSGDTPSILQVRHTTYSSRC